MRKPWKVFSSVQWGPTRSRYMVSYKTSTDTFVKAYMEAK